MEYGVLRSEGYTERALFVIDKRGVISYIDIHDIDHQPSNEDLLAVIRRIDPEAAAREPKEPPKPAAVPLPRGGIVMYCTPWCPDCKKARNWMVARKLKFTEIDIYATPGASDQVRKWNKGALVTPTFDIDGTIVAEFSEERISKLLKLN